MLLFFIELLYKVISRAQSRFEQKIFENVDPLVDQIFKKLKSFSIQIWFKIPRGFKGRYYLRWLYEIKEYEPEGLKTTGPFLLDFDKSFIPLRIAPESPQKASSSIISLQKVDRGGDIWEILSNKSKESVHYRCLAIIAPPGFGKTTLLRHITLTYITQRQRNQHQNAIKLIPILLYLRDTYEIILYQFPSPTLARLVEQQELVEKLNPPPNWFENRLKDGSCLVMLDGLDEIADKMQRQQVSSWINRQIKNYPKTRFIVTARPNGYNEAPLKGFAQFEVQPLNLAQAREFIGKWYQQREISLRLGKNTPIVREKAKKKANNLIARIESNSSIGVLTKNPLLLTMIAIVHNYRGALPGNRIELYEEICEVLIELRQRAKRLPQTLMPAQQKTSLLQLLAKTLMEKGENFFDLNEVDKWIRDMLAIVSKNKTTTEQFLKDIESTSGLIVEKESGFYEFTHKSLQEYLTATFLKERNGTDFLVSKISNTWWHEVIRLYAAMGNANKLVIAAYKEGITGNINLLTLAVDCAEEGVGVKPLVREKIELKLLAPKCLEAKKKKIARMAAQVKLNRRLRNLLPISETIEIDPRCISCAEYQLFLNEKYKSGKNLKPNHWKTYQFPMGDAVKPITGVLSSNAREFCEWLNQQSNTLEYAYRLPTKDEIQAEKNQVSHRKNSMFEMLGYWCQEGEYLLIEGLPETYWQTLNKEIHKIIKNDLKNLREFIQDLQKVQTEAQKLRDFLESSCNLAQELLEARIRYKRSIDGTMDRVRDCQRNVQKVRNTLYSYASELTHILRLLKYNYIPASKSKNKY
ncbi:MAG: NACHT domain-containing protein [Symploca sp. SIO1C4]|uniref:NACHT domain-containing protein n=1 Tax=Symploca sp. SIO1C4 TaxID=2607765 RepID=A0A6B3NAX2_9CYAN|nr:NACHT domain-containing protein [Symploca sp. SIO1C4]